jgi:hypothetical protein
MARQSQSGRNRAGRNLAARNLVSGAAACCLFALSTQPARADESGTSLYLLGSGGPGAAIMPPLKGLYFDDTVYIYDASSSAQRNFVIGGKVVADVHASVAADFFTTLWVPSTNFIGGTLALGAIVPVGAPMVDAAAVLTGPGGRTLDVRRHDSTLAVGDPVGTVMLGWTMGKFHLQTSGLVNFPVGYYREGQLANIAFHRWAGDVSLAGTWHDDTSGWDVSGKLGVTFNGTNTVTDYTSGTDFHVEAAVEKAVSPKWSLGVLGYYFNQLTDDSGSGATLGGYRGRVGGAGGTIAFNTLLHRMPATFRFKLLEEFAAENRTQGTVGMISLTVPISLKMPPHP